MATYVLIHGAYQGGWIWKPVARRLTSIEAEDENNRSEGAILHRGIRTQVTDSPLISVVPVDNTRCAKHEQRHEETLCRG